MYRGVEERSVLEEGQEEKDERGWKGKRRSEQRDKEGFMGKAKEGRMEGRIGGEVDGEVERKRTGVG